MRDPENFAGLGRFSEGGLLPRRSRDRVYPVIAASLKLIERKAKKRH